MVRTVVLLASLALIVALALATIRDLARHGPTGLGIVSLGILGLLGFGIVGAITHRDPHE
jgi:hypothetical protein